MNFPSQRTAAKQVGFSAPDTIRSLIRFSISEQTILLTSLAPDGFPSLSLAISEGISSV